MAKKEGRPSWFKMFLSQKALIDSVSDEVAGKALKQAFNYFEIGEKKDSATLAPKMDSLTFAVFSTIKPYIDESFDDYIARAKDGKEGADKRWNKR